ncbi:hypothetical protein [Haloarchaeobius sp. HME9146]|uniref:hypothetical protein n=1 Tax=Haloarchaeobius sp. HME9146 TaxID=2978732 RepID=UPI0021C14823|nr:hypothetical protein [Haloarchaeobius sp. HME9146]MCT9095774.1 hypothetical protein [Haloarchaeobius sp. HME9146]
MSNPEQSPYDDVLTLGDIAAVLTDRTLLRQFGVVALTLLTAGLAFGLIPMLFGQYGDHNLLQLAGGPGAEQTAQTNQNNIGRLVYIFAPILAPMLATVVTFVSSAVQDGRRRTVVPAAMAGAFVGCLLFLLVSTWLPHTQFAVVENAFPFDSTVPPYDTAGVLLNGALSGLAGALGALGAALAGSLLG